MRFAWIAERPFNYLENGRVTGCDVELARHVFSRLGETFEPVETEFAQLLNGLVDGRWDVTTGMFITPERSARAAFTLPIWALRDGLLVSESDAGLIDGYRGLARLGGQLAVLHGQVQRQTALGLGIDAESIVTFHDYSEAAQAVVEGVVRAYASVERAHREHIVRRPGGGLACVAVPTSEKPAEPGAFACRAPRTRDRLDEALRDFLGTEAHIKLLASFGFTPEEIAARV